MGKVTFATMDDACMVGAPGERAEGMATYALFEGSRNPIHVFVHEFQPGVTLQFDQMPTDLVAYVWNGAVHAGRTRLDHKSVIILERGAEGAVRACEEGATLVTFRATAESSPQRNGGNVHLLPQNSVPRASSFEGREHVGGALYADARCPTCEVWLHENTLRKGNWNVGVHSHSEDEVIFVIEGAIRLGARLYGPGSAISVTADTKYSFTTGPDGLTFINFRPSAPTYRSADGAQSWSEAEKWVRDLGQTPSYLELVF